MSSTKINEALKVNKRWTIVEAAREFGDREYNESGVKVALPSGMNRVDIDARPMGDLGAVFKNYDYVGSDSIGPENPGLGLFKHQENFDSVNDFRKFQEQHRKNRKVRPSDYDPPEIRTAERYNDILKLAELFQNITSKE
jgi:hypothetical protein